MATAAAKGQPERENNSDYFSVDDPANKASAIEQKVRDRMDLCLHVLSIGVSPSKVKVDCKGVNDPTKKIHMVWEQVIRECLQHYVLNQKSKIMIASEEKEPDPSWALCVLLLDCLIELKSCVDGLELFPHVKDSGIDVLSIQSQINIQKAVEIINGLGLASNLPPRMGLEKEFSMEISTSKTTSEFQKFLRVEFVLEQLNTLCDHPTFAKRIFGKSLMHYFAASIHVAYSPISDPRVRSRASPLSESDYLFVIALQRKFREKFENVTMTRIPSTRLIACLFPLSRDTTPKWYRLRCRELALNIFVKHGGMNHVVKGLYELFGGARAGARLSEITKVVKNLVTDALRHAKTKTGRGTSSMFDGWCNQACEIILWGKQEKKDKNGKFWVQLGTCIAIGLAQTKFEPTKKYIWNHVFYPMLAINRDKEAGSSLHCDEVDFILPVCETILWYQDRDQTDLERHHILKFRGIWTQLFKIFVCLYKYMKSPAKLLAVVERIEPTMAKLISLIKNYLELVHSLGKPKLFEICQDFISFYGTDGQLSPVRYVLSVPCDDENNTSTNTNVVIVRDAPTDHVSETYAIACEDCKIFFQGILMYKRRSKTVLTSLFAQLIIHEYKEFFPEIEKINKSDYVEDSEKPLNVLELYDEKNVSKFVTMTLLGEFGSENHLNDCISIEGQEDILGFTIIVFRRVIGELNRSENCGQNYAFMGSLDYSLELTKAITEVLKNPNSAYEHFGVEEVHYHWGDLQPFIPFLKKVMDSKQVGIYNTPTQVNAEAIYIQIMTKGVGSKTEVKSSKYLKAMESVDYIVLPQRIGQGLMELKDLIGKKDPEALNHTEEILKKSLQCLCHEDTWVYGWAASAISKLGTVCYKEVLPILMETYITGSNKFSDDCNQIKARLNIGQCITEIIRNLGEMVQVFKFPLLNTAMIVLREEDPLMRVSALSLLAELTLQLKFSLEMILSDIWLAVEDILKIEKDVYVRQSTMFLVSDMLKGMNKTITPDYALHSPEIGEALRNIRRKIQLYRQTEKDEPILLHMQMCLDELSEISNKLMTPSLKIEKHIRILGP